MIPLPLQKLFRHQKLSETPKGFRYEIFSYCETKIILTKLAIPPPVTHSFLIAETLRNSKWAPHEIFLGDEKFSTNLCENLTTDHQLFFAPNKGVAPECFRYTRDFCKHKKRPLLKIRYGDSARPKDFDIFRWYFFWYTKDFAPHELRHVLLTCFQLVLFPLIDLPKVK